MKGWVGLVGWPAADGFPHKGSPFNCRLSVGKVGGWGPTFYQLCQCLEVSVLVDIRANKLAVQNVEKTDDVRREVMSTSRGSVDNQAVFRAVSPSGETHETTSTTKFESNSPEVSTTSTMTAAAAAAAAALSHQRMLMSPLPFDRVSRHTFTICNQ